MMPLKCARFEATKTYASFLYCRYLVRGSNISKVEEQVRPVHVVVVLGLFMQMGHLGGRLL